MTQKAYCHCQRLTDESLVWSLDALTTSGITHSQVCCFGETLASLLVRGPFLHARGLLASIDFSFLFTVGCADSGSTVV
eukprot:scaffold47583_cov22-Tisochrysis_lutea.AAC.1